MITHFAELSLQTVSLTGVRQVYEERLEFQVVEEREDSVGFAVTPHTVLRFVEKPEPIRPAHIAFEVRHSTFDRSADFLKERGVLICGDIIKAHSKRRYFRDGDGNLMEIYSHDYVREDVLPAGRPLGVLFLREAGFVVDDHPAFHNWMCSTFAMQSYAEEAGIFSMLVAGTAYPIVNHTGRDWIPIAMKALKPGMEVVFGTPSRSFLGRVAGDTGRGCNAVHPGSPEATFEMEGYRISLRHTPDFGEEIPGRLGPSLSDLKMDV